MCLNNLAAERKPDARSARFGSKEWHKKIGGIRNPRPFILNKSSLDTLTSKP
jgi:hypothetical protein